MFTEGLAGDFGGGRPVFANAGDIADGGGGRSARRSIGDFGGGRPVFANAGDIADGGGGRSARCSIGDLAEYFGGGRS
jgi:hypothetical protein